MAGAMPREAGKAALQWADEVLKPASIPAIIASRQRAVDAARRAAGLRPPARRHLQGRANRAFPPTDRPSYQPPPPPPPPPPPDDPPPPDPLLDPGAVEADADRARQRRSHVAARSRLDCPTGCCFPNTRQSPARCPVPPLPRRAGTGIAWPSASLHPARWHKAGSARTARACRPGAVIRSSRLRSAIDRYWRNPAIRSSTPRPSLVGAAIHAKAEITKGRASRGKRSGKKRPVERACGSSGKIIAAAIKAASTAIAVRTQRPPVALLRPAAKQSVATSAAPALITRVDRSAAPSASSKARAARPSAAMNEPSPTSDQDQLRRNSLPS